MLGLHFKTAFLPSPSHLPSMHILEKSSNSALFFFNNDVIVRHYEW